MQQTSNTQLKARASRKTNPPLQETILAARKNPKWNVVAKLLSGPTRRFTEKNLFEIDKESKAGETIVIVGKVLSKGELTKKVRICALSVSEKAHEKIKAQKSELVSVLEEIMKNPKAEGIKLLK